MNIENIMLKEMSTTERQLFHDFNYMRHPENQTHRSSTEWNQCHDEWVIYGF
jgi:hypothetical protein